MANIFRGPSTPAMRLTLFLIGTAALAAGIFTATVRVKASAANKYGVVDTYCGTAFDPMPRRSFFPALADACENAISGYPQTATVMFAIAAIFLVRFLYMMVGPKAAPK
ncbi:hypothetical protein [Arthrobacter sp. SLBN-112]|uniref:hypothetical protein n=1 Tax=Arthrobacter sp. SLBN-112 TaxID=2768452 RepID=UPI0027AF5E24|nr:hypothetical protein [Arthrobacter sp. SLBN-112]MDQ0801507.1 hypothetical protein [Arthrobacter sp. SLBN-112]